MEPTLGQIKEYLRSNNIKLELPIKDSSVDESLYGNSEAEVYFNYYLEHSVEIHNWLSQETQEKEHSNENNFHI